MLGSDKLVEIPPNDWPELRDIFLLNWPDNIIAWHIVNNYIQWHRKESQIKNLNFYCLNGNWRSDGFVVVDRYQLFVYTLDLTNEKLRRTLNLLDWTKGYKILSFLKRHRSAIDDVVYEQRLRIKDEDDTFSHLYFLSREEAKKLKLMAPSNVFLKPLSANDAELINNCWDNRKHDGSLNLVKRLIEWNSNIGAYNERGDLMAWCLRLQDGSLGAFNVNEKYRGNGLGCLVITAMCKILASMHLDVFMFVNPNSQTKLILERLNFKHRDDGFWVTSLPREPTYTWTD